MKTKTKPVKPWSKLTQEQRVARVNSLVGKYAGLRGGGVEEFLREKHEETEREELRYQEEHPSR